MSVAVYQVEAVVSFLISLCDIDNFVADSIDLHNSVLYILQRSVKVGLLISKRFAVLAKLLLS